MLPERDTAWLDAQWPEHRVGQDGGQVAVVLPDFGLPQGFNPGVVDVLLLAPFGYPDTPLDMFWVAPAVTLHGAMPQAATRNETHLGQTWQRFSRHLPPGIWRPGADGLQSYVALITTMLTREAGSTARAA